MTISEHQFSAALDFARLRIRALGQPRPKLPEVTCFCATSVRISRAISVLRHCANVCEFGEIVLATHEAGAAAAAPFARVVPVRQMVDRRSYSALILNELGAMIRTEYVLVVQDDGFILNPGAWKDDFYACDYIGAPWPPTLTIDPPGTTLNLVNRVGNGGFSLRSRRLLDACSLDSLYRPEYGMVTEDLLIGHFNYRRLSDLGIRFAGLTLASCFSGETPSDEGLLHLDSVFGFHGNTVLDALARQAVQMGLAASIEPGPPQV